MEQLKLLFDDEPEFFNDDKFKNNNQVTYIDFKKYNTDIFLNLSKTHKKNNGIFYTKNLSILEEINNNIPFDDKSLFLDPSCGEGDILLFFIQKFVDKFFKKHSQEIILKKIFDLFWGFDIEPNACLSTKYNIYNLLSKFIDKNIISKFDFNLLNIHCIDFSLKSNIIKYKKKFDLIIGNPPFITYYGKHAKKLSQEKKQYYIHNYNFITKKKIDNRLNSSMFFIENAIELLNNGGIFSYILDISFFEPPYHQIKKFLKQYEILSIIDDIKGFDDVYSGQIILTVKKRTQITNKILWKSFDTKKTSIISSKTFNFKKPLDNYDQKIIDKIILNTKPLKNFFLQEKKGIRTCAVLTGKTEEFVSDKTDKNSSNNFYPFLEGSKGLPERFQIIEPKNRFLEYNYKKQIEISDIWKIELGKLGIKNKKRIGLGNEIAYKNPKVFIRQSAKKIICAYTEKPMCANNSIYVMFKNDITDENKSLLKYLCCILNSEILTFYALKKNIIRIQKGKIPQIRLSDLYNLPICFAENKIKLKLLNLIYNNNNNIDYLEMNKIIAELYNITNDEYLYIKNYNYTMEKNNAK